MDIEKLKSGVVKYLQEHTYIAPFVDDMFKSIIEGGEKSDGIIYSISQESDSERAVCEHCNDSQIHPESIMTAHLMPRPCMYCSQTDA